MQKIIHNPSTANLLSNYMLFFKYLVNVLMEKALNKGLVRLDRFLILLSQEKPTLFENSIVLLSDFTLCTGSFYKLCLQRDQKWPVSEENFLILVKTVSWFIDA